MVAPTPAPRPTAADAYRERLAAVRTQLARIDEALTGHEAGAALNANDWGYVGDLARVLRQLSEVLETS